jgi:hypothetical protein
MNPPKTARVPLRVWSATIIGIISILFTASFLHNRSIEKERKSQNAQFDFEIERLQKIENNGLVVVGTSLTQHGFPFDAELSVKARERGISIHFVRFSHSGLENAIFKKLMPEILRSHPRWVFVQAEPFFLNLEQSETKKTIREASIRKHIETLHSHIHYLFRNIYSTLQLFFPRLAGLEANTPARTSKIQWQDDSRIFLEGVAQFDMIKNSTDTVVVLQPAFPHYIEEFIEEAKKLGITVVLLEMNRSKAGNENFGESFRTRLTDTLQQVSQRYHIPYWQFRGDLPLDCYIDRAHLNLKGRAVFTNWFLEKFAREFGNDGS